MQSPLDEALVRRLYDRAKADRWDLPVSVFAAALTASAERAAATPGGAPRDVERHLEALHLEDLAVACACASGNDAAWEHVMRQHRPALYRAADALEPGGGARDLADSLYAELYGLRESDGARQSLFRYFHGRSSLATWLRAVLGQRYVDRVRLNRRLEPLPLEETAGEITSPVAAPNPDGPRYIKLIADALSRALSALDARDRLRLGLYYGQQVKLAEIGRLLREHEATVSRHLTRSRRLIREDIERQLRDHARLSETEITECFASVMDDPGPLDLTEIFGAADQRKNVARDRSR